MAMEIINLKKEKKILNIFNVFVAVMYQKY